MGSLHYGCKITAKFCKDHAVILFLNKVKEADINYEEKNRNINSNRGL